MHPPEISAGILASLIVTALILLILVPGLLCLYSIQSPASFVAEREDISATRKDQ
jgi:hypothetical protein